MSSDDAGRRVVVVTGGGGGIGAAIAMELGRRGDHVVTVDPLVSVDGAAAAVAAGPTTADRIVEAGGRARASAASVTDAAAMRALLDELVAEHGRVDAVVNVAGITRPTGFASGNEEDWAAVLAVHLEGYCNVLDAALPHMAAAGSGRIVGVTSGSGWRMADAGAYSCAKRAVASLTWQLGRVAPPGVAVNAISPIAMTRMVTEAMSRAKAAAQKRSPESGAASKPRRATGGLSLGGMPAPEALGPLGAHLASADGTSLRGQILFAGGSEVALVRPPRLLEAIRTPDPTMLDPVLAAVLETWAAAEAAQTTTGGANPRFGALYDTDPGVDSKAATTAAAGRALVVGSGRLARGAGARLAALGADTVLVGSPGEGFTGARRAVERAAADGPLDAIVVDAVEASEEVGDAPWSAVVADHAGLADRILTDARWARAAAEHSAAAGRPLRLIVLVDAATPAGRSRAQAAAQLARAGAGATADRVAAIAVSVEDRHEVDAAAALAAALSTDGRAGALAGAELAVGPGWIGLRSHPTPAGSIVFGGPQLPAWFDAALAEIAGSESAPGQPR